MAAVEAGVAVVGEAYPHLPANSESLAQHSREMLRLSAKVVQKISVRGSHTM